MPVIEVEQGTVEYFDEGSGPCVTLIHSSASGPLQWRRLTSDLSGRRHVIAPCLFGYGRTSSWSGSAPQTVADQAALVEAVLRDVDGQIDLVGHSFGALVALELSARLGSRAGRMVLFEPNAFALLDRADCADEFREVRAIHRHVADCARTGEWSAIAARFTDYFSGEGAWDAMPVERKAAVAAAVVPNPHEWDAAMSPSLRDASWLSDAPPALLIWSRDTRRPLRAVAKILAEAHPEWRTHEMEGGGHLAPMMRSRAVNSLARHFLESGAN